jgi:Hint domain
MLIFAACTAARGSGGPGVSAAPATPAASPLPVFALKYRLIDQLGRPWFCDPDFFPVARQDEGAVAVSRFAEVQADPAFSTIVERLALAGTSSFTDAQKLAIYREWKALNAVILDPQGDRYRFDLLTKPKAAPSDGTEGTGTRFGGTITNRGVIAIEQQAPAGASNCPICLARGSRIATPLGEIAVEDLRVGDPVWTADAGGDRVAATILEVGSVRVPADHQVVHLVLEDGRQVFVSPGHPLPDGRSVGSLRAGDPFDGSSVIAADLVPYSGGATFDLLPAGATGTYWAGGILLGSTLRP